MTSLPVLLLYHEAKVVASCVAVNLSYLVTHILRCGYYYSTISMLKRYLVTIFVSKASLAACLCQQVISPHHLLLWEMITNTFDYFLTFSVQNS